MKKIIITTFIAISGLIAWFIYLQLFSIELDADANNSPIDSIEINLKTVKPMEKRLSLAAGFAYDQYNDRFFVSTDIPHTLFAKKEAKIFVLDADFKILSHHTVKTKGDLEGMVMVDETTLKVLSDTGELFTIYVSDNHIMEVSSSQKVFTDNKSHKTGSLAFDGKDLYTAEKEGEKVFYKLSLDGQLLETFKLQNFENEKSFTVAGMTSVDGFFFVLSEAYSTIFKVDPIKKEITESYGVEGMNECSGITTDKKLFYCIGDGESYIPEQNFYIFDINEKLNLSVCGEDGNRYENGEAALSAGLSYSQFGATYCPEYKTIIHESWDMNKDNLIDCGDESVCDLSIDYSLPKENY